MWRSQLATHVGSQSSMPSFGFTSDGIDGQDRRSEPATALLYYRGDHCSS
jgi:hypothetical protein